MYTIVDKKSDLHWQARDAIELMNFSTSRRTRTQIDDEKRREESKWQDNFEGSAGYGEITRVSNLF